MLRYRGLAASRDGASVCRAAICTALAGGMIGCGSGQGTAARSTEPIVLRVGVGQITSGNPLGGLQQVAGNQSFEGLVKIGPDGRPRSWLARNWNVAADGLSMTLELRHEAKFHDGSPASAPVLVQALRTALPRFIGPVFEDIERIDASADGRRIEVRFKRPSPFLLESLEAVIRKPGAPTVGTGAYVAGPGTLNEMRANRDYYLGRPIIDRIVVTSYPTVRAAWAEMLRNNIDVLYEVGPDAVSSMQNATNVSMFTFTRAYQYVVLLNVRAPKLESPEVRRALNAAIDRTELVRDGFDGHATAATGLVWPQNWAVSPDVQPIAFDPQSAAARLRTNPPLRFTCLVPTDYERIALVVQRQLAAVGVTMDVEAVAPDRAVRAFGTPSFEAVLTDIIGGPSMLRAYEMWHSKGSTNPGGIDSPELDVALDRIRHAASDDEYRAAVANFQTVTTDNPPAIYLAWGERARAVTKRFEVPVEAGRDVLSTLRLWKPAPAERTSRP